MNEGSQRKSSLEAPPLPPGMRKPRSKREAGGFPRALSPPSLPLAESETDEAFTRMVGLTSRLASERRGKLLSCFYRNAPSMPLQFSRAGRKGSKASSIKGEPWEGESRSNFTRISI